MVKFMHLAKLSCLFSVSKICNAALFPPAYQGAAGLETEGEFQFPQGLENALDADAKVISGDSGETDYEYNESGPNPDVADLAVNGGNLAVESMDEANALLDSLMGVRHGESTDVTEISDLTSLYSVLLDQFNAISVSVADLCQKILNLTDYVQNGSSNNDSNNNSNNNGDSNSNSNNSDNNDDSNSNSNNSGNSDSNSNDSSSSDPNLVTCPTASEKSSLTGPFSLFDGSTEQIKLCIPGYGRSCIFRLRLVSKDNITQTISDFANSYTLGVVEAKICEDSSTRSSWKINNSGKIVGKNCKWFVQADGAVVCHKTSATSFSYSTSTGQLEVTQGDYSGKCVGINAETSDNLGAMKAYDCATVESTYGLPVVGW